MDESSLNNRLEPPKRIEDPCTIQKPNRSTPLGVLFLFVAVCSVLVGLVVPGVAAIRESSVEIVATIGILVLGMGGGSVVGFLVGLLFEDRIAAALIGSFVGAVAGFIATLMSVTKTASTPRVLLTAVAGSIIVLACAFIMRQRSANETRD